MPNKLTWDDPVEIALALRETMPDLDPTNVRFTDLHKWVTGLDGFADDPSKSNEAKLERIFTLWLEEFQDNS